MTAMHVCNDLWLRCDGARIPLTTATSAAECVAFRGLFVCCGLAALLNLEVIHCVSSIYMWASVSTCWFCCSQGAALAELQALFPALANTGAPSATTEVLLSALLDEGRGRREVSSTDGSVRQAQHGVALCCAVLVVPAGQVQIDATVKQLLQMLKSADPGEVQCVVAPMLLCRSMGYLKHTNGSADVVQSVQMLASAHCTRPSASQPLYR